LSVVTPNVGLTVQEAKRVMEKFLADIRLPLEISEECLLQREKRVGIEQCHDEVEKCLSKVRLQR
jgi:Tektin family